MEWKQTSIFHNFISNYSKALIIQTDIDMNLYNRSKPATFWIVCSQNVARINLKSFGLKLPLELEAD